MSDTTIRLTDDGPVRYRNGGVTFERGVAKATDADHADALLETGHFERVSDAGSGGSGGEDAPPENIMDADLPKRTVKEIRAAASNADLTTDQQATLMERERDGKNRTSALQAIEDAED